MSWFLDALQSYQNQWGSFWSDPWWVETDVPVLLVLTPQVINKYRFTFILYVEEHLCAQ